MYAAETERAGDSIYPINRKLPLPKPTVEFLDGIGGINQGSDLLRVLEIGREIRPVCP